MKILEKICGLITHHKMFREYLGYCDSFDYKGLTEHYYECKICGKGYWNYNPPTEKEKKRWGIK